MRGCRRCCRRWRPARTRSCGTRRRRRCRTSGRMCCGGWCVGAGGSEGLAYMEWAAQPDVALDDSEVWAVANPGLGIRLNEDVIRAEMGAMDPEDFARERLG